MRAIPVASAALLGACALTSCVPVAGAAGQGGGSAPFGFAVRPSTIAPGGEVTLEVDREGGGCKGPATVSAPVFDPVTIHPGHTSARAVVDWDAKPGAVHQVLFRCDGATGTASLTIAGGVPTQSPTPPPSTIAPPPPPPEHPGHGEHPGHPQKGVHAGEGGTAAGFGLRNIGLGAALVVGSVGAAYHFSRRRSGTDGP
ncbi:MULTISPECIES: hypothetical protein [Streptomyces]|uniref:Lipoprotein n=2 Tax=Streptomyces TaxID=1883 RepID=A0ABT9LQD7_STRGD|nr:MULTISPECIES: hypothetical protein [Streptomyces]MDP9685755.1 hypothetical protein [Streptomyces griseoviridis]GGS77015.1 lipoprotein [Streptomyces griseoviridis]GGU14397.1 lipoprotein [Streptomyces daghestanicus]GHI35046.1 lipoprotein [Streptomyces daghestanicus]